jgi:hypothetical protein
MVLRCACQLTDYEILSVIRTPATRPEFAERAACLDQPRALLVRKVCIFVAYEGYSSYTHTHTYISIHTWTHLPGHHSSSLYRLW